jgi:hypothetical protein
MPRWGGLRPEPYKLSPPDADRDMIVQEGTAWERPGGLRLLDRLGNAIQAGTESLSPVDGLRYVGTDGKDVAYVPTWVGGEDKVPGTGLQTLSDMPGVRTVGDMTGGSSSLKDRGLALGDRRKAVAEAIREAQKAQAVQAVVVPEWKPGDPLPKRSGTRRDVVDTSKRKKDVVDSSTLILDEDAYRVDLKFDSEGDRESLESELLSLLRNERGADAWGSDWDEKSEEEERLEKLLVEVQKTVDVAAIVGEDPDDPFADTEGTPARPAEFFGEEAVNHLKDIFSSDENKNTLDKIREQRKIEAIEKARNDLEWESRDKIRKSATEVIESYRRKDLSAREERERDDTQPSRDFSAEQVAISDQSDVEQRDLATLIDHADGTMIYARDITEDPMAENAAVIVDLERITSSLDFMDAHEKREGVWRSSPGTATPIGRKLVDDLVEARGFDADTLKVTSDELDELLLSGGFIEVARGGHRQYQEDHLDGTILMGTGVDGAGLYFALERKEGGAFAAAAYAATETDGAVIRGGLNPTAKTIHVKKVNKIVGEYGRSVGDKDHYGVPTPMSEGDEIAEDLNELLQVRQALSLKAQGLTIENGKVIASPVDEEMKSRALKQLKNLDLMLLESNDAEDQHSTTAAAVLMGYDAVLATSSDMDKNDNRVIVLNRSAVVVADTLLDVETVDGQSYSIDRDGKRVVGEEALAQRMESVLDDRGVPRFVPDGLSVVDDEFVETEVEKTLRTFDKANAPKAATSIATERRGPHDKIGRAHDVGVSFRLTATAASRERSSASPKPKRFGGTPPGRERNEWVKEQLERHGGFWRMTPEERKAFSKSQESGSWGSSGDTGVELLHDSLGRSHRKAVVESLQGSIDSQMLLIGNPDIEVEDQERYKIFVARLQKGIDYLDTHTDEEFLADLAKSLRIWHEDEDNQLAVQIPHGEIFASFLEDGYKTTHEVESQHSPEDIRADYEVTQGIPKDAPDSVRPASGSVVGGARMRQIEADNAARVHDPNTTLHEERDEALTDATQTRKTRGVSIYGGIQLILNEDVKERTKAGSGDTLNDSIRGAPMVGATDAELVESFLAVEGGKGADHKRWVEKIARALELVMDGPGENLETIGTEDFGLGGKHGDDPTTRRIGREIYVEALIYGAFDIGDVAEINIPSTVWESTFERAHQPGLGFNPQASARGDIMETLMETVRTGKDIEGVDPQIVDVIRRALVEDAEAVRAGMIRSQYESAMTGIASMRKRAGMLAAIREKNKEVKVTFTSHHGVDMDNVAMYTPGESEEIKARILSGDITLEELLQQRVITALETLAHEIENYVPPAPVVGSVV